MSKKPPLTKREFRHFIDKIRVLSWTEVDRYEKGDPIEIGSVAIPGGGPGDGLWCIQESATSLAMTQKAYMDARSRGRTLIFHQMEINLQKGSPLPSDDLEIDDDEVIDLIRLLPIDHMNNALDWAILGRLGRKIGLLGDLSGRTLLEEFQKNKELVGAKLFEVMPSLKVITWRLSKDEFPSGTVRAACVRDAISIVSVTNFISGIGEREIEWSVPDGSFNHHRK